MSYTNYMACSPEADIEAIGIESQFCAHGYFPTVAIEPCQSPIIQPACQHSIGFTPP